MQKVFLILFVGVLGIWVSQQTQKTPIVDDVLLENVEALASDDEIIIKKKEVYYPQPGDSNYGTVKCVCWGDGDIPCC